MDLGSSPSLVMRECRDKNGRGNPTCGNQNPPIKSRSSPLAGGKTHVRSRVAQASRRANRVTRRAAHRRLWRSTRKQQRIGLATPSALTTGMYPSSLEVSTPAAQVRSPSDTMVDPTPPPLEVLETIDAILVLDDIIHGKFAPSQQFVYPKPIQKVRPHPPNTRTKLSTTKLADWASTRDAGAGVSRLLWSEEIAHCANKANFAQGATHSVQVEPPHMQEGRNEVMRKEAESIKPRTLKEIFKNLKIVFWNVKGMSHIGARQQIVYLMKEYKIDVLMFSATHIPQNTYEIHDGLKQCEEKQQAAEKLREETKKHPKNLTPEQRDNFKFECQKKWMRVNNIAFEKHGMAVVYSPDIKPYVVDCIQHDAKNMTLQMQAKIGLLNITNTHVPHAGSSTKIKNEHYRLLERIDDEYGKTPNIHILGGDWNARLVERLPAETETIGPFILNEEGLTTDILSMGQKDNRDRFMDFCLERNFQVSNTWFQKPTDKLVTFRRPGIENFTPPYLLCNYAQCDHILIKNSWKNSVLDIESADYMPFESDHRPLTLKFRSKIARKPKLKDQKSDWQGKHKYRKPDEDTAKAYNDKIRELVDQHDWSATMEPLKDWADIIMKAAYSKLQIIPPDFKREYISNETFEKIKAKEQAKQAEDWPKVHALEKEIRSHLREEKRKHQLEQLEEIGEHGYRWEGIKRLKSKFSPKTCKFKDKEGDRIPPKMYSSKAAEYLEQVQWEKASSLPPIKIDPPILTQPPTPIKDEPFHIMEMNVICDKLKNKKQPGPDGLCAELVKWMDQTSRELLLGEINKIVEKDSLEETLNLARIASIYKKGDSANLANYRPIALLQTIYKVVAALIKERVDAGLDGIITKTQYGFRRGRSTSQAIFIARRLLDLAESQKSNMSVILLDWEKAFDKIDHDRLLEALQRLGIQGNMLKLISMIYQTPKFKVVAGEEESDYKRQRSGIRQGCPLSPYLFVLVMAVIFQDIKLKLTTPKQKQPIPGINFAEIMYADDTLVFGTNTNCINILLREVQEQSKYYNLNLNVTKCINITANQKVSSVRLSKHAEKMRREHRATYLGAILTDDFDNRAEMILEFNKGNLGPVTQAIESITGCIAIRPPPKQHPVKTFSPTAPWNQALFAIADLGKRAEMLRSKLMAQISTFMKPPPNLSQTEINQLSDLLSDHLMSQDHQKLVGWICKFDAGDLAPLRDEVKAFMATHSQDVLKMLESDDANIGSHSAQAAGSSSDSPPKFMPVKYDSFEISEKDSYDPKIVYTRGNVTWEASLTTWALDFKKKWEHASAMDKTHCAVTELWDLFAQTFKDWDQDWYFLEIIEVLKSGRFPIEEILNAKELPTEREKLLRNAIYFLPWEHQMSNKKIAARMEMEAEQEIQENQEDAFRGTDETWDYGPSKKDPLFKKDPWSAVSWKRDDAASSDPSSKWSAVAPNWKKQYRGKGAKPDENWAKTKNRWNKEAQDRDKSEGWTQQ